jgi:hypothetical protein
MAFKGSGANDLARLIGQFTQATPAQLAARATPKIEATTREKVRARLEAVPTRKDGSPSTAAHLADLVRVEATGTSFRLVIDHPAVPYLQHGTSRMAARPLVDEDEFRAVIEECFAEAIAEVFR